MKITQSNLEKLSLKYYSFAYALLPDELMATQLLIDSITKMAIVYKDSDEEVIMDELFELDFIKNIFAVSVIRTEHFKKSNQLESFNHQGQDSAFFLMGLKERACLFLRDKLHFSFTDTAYAIGISYEEVLAIIHRSRAEFMDLIDHSEPEARSSYAH